MIKIGLTGSIASGKTFVGECFEDLGIPVFNADKAVHVLMEKGGRAVKAISENFPESVIDGKIDRKILGSIVFYDDSSLKKLEEIMHPLVNDLEKEFIEENKNSEFVVLEIPLLFEKGSEGKYNYIVVTYAADDIRKQRVMKREGMTIERFEKVKSLQMDNNKKKEKADFIINTEYTKKEILEELKTLLEKMKGN